MWLFTWMFEIARDFFSHAAMEWLLPFVTTSLTLVFDTISDLDPTGVMVMLFDHLNMFLSSQLWWAVMTIVTYIVHPIIPVPVIIAAETYCILLWSASWLVRLIVWVWGLVWSNAG